MTDHAPTVPAKKVQTGALIGGLALGMVAASMGQAPAAGATCASFFGIGNSANCTSTLTSIAIAIGAGAKAGANGLFGAAIAVGANSEARTSGGGVFKGGSLLNLAAVIGQGSFAQTGGVLGVHREEQRGLRVRLPQQRDGVIRP